MPASLAIDHDRFAVVVVRIADAVAVAALAGLVVAAAEAMALVKTRNQIG